MKDDELLAILQHGNAETQFEIGMSFYENSLEAVKIPENTTDCYIGGSGFDFDGIQAKIFFEAAAKKGHKKAKEMLDKIKAVQE
jgi:hypothetical protein